RAHKICREGWSLSVGDLCLQSELEIEKRFHQGKMKQRTLAVAEVFYPKRSACRRRLKDNRRSSDNLLEVRRQHSEASSCLRVGGAEFAPAFLNRVVYPLQCFFLVQS